ncbi:hypothetical protein ACX80R_05025 [Paeniglutamicibacter antarcticus]|uniref:Uncharacterized protein n=1 Tax=Paeniglutamicibacter antarcticus TaxID=494023 RepID=A0ABP9TL85_9MICC
MTLLVCATAVGLAWPTGVGQKLEPLLATTVLWFAFASILIGLFGMDVESTSSKTVWTACLLAGTACMAIAQIAAVASSRKYTRKIGGNLAKPACNDGVGSTPLQGASDAIGDILR